MKAYKIVFISILSFVIYSPLVSSKENNAPDPAAVEQIKAEWAAQVSASEQETYTPAWEKNFNDLHIQSAALLEENTRLSREHQALQEELTRLAEEVEERENKNKSLQDDLVDKKAFKDRKQRKKKAELQEQRQKELDDKNVRIAEYNRQIEFLEKKIALGRLKLKSSGVDDHTDEILAIEDELDHGRAELEDNDRRAAALKEKLQSISVDEKKLDPAVLSLKEEIDALHAEIARLGDSKQADRSSDKDFSPALSAEEKINELTKKKADLQADLEEMKARMAKIKNSQVMGITNERVKKIVEEIAQVDAANEQLREEAKYLQENIAILKTHVKKLEYQADAINSMKGKMTPVEYLKTAF